MKVCSKSGKTGCTKGSGGKAPMHWRSLDCRWAPGDIANVAGAKVVRLIVDQRLWSYGMPNVHVQARFVEDITRFVGQRLSQAAIVAPAGAFTMDIQYPPAGPEALQTELGSLESQIPALSQRSAFDWLVGLDGVHNGVTPIQSVIWLPGGALPGGCTATKVYPTSNEASFLSAWRFSTRRHFLAGGRGPLGASQLVPLVCHELVAFSGRARAVMAQGGLRQRALQDLRRFVGGSRGNFVAACVHRLTAYSSGQFMNGATNVENSHGTTVALSAFAPVGELDLVSTRFCPTGPRAHEVVTLLVRGVRLR